MRYGLRCAACGQAFVLEAWSIGDLEQQLRGMGVCPGGFHPAEPSLYCHVELFREIEDA